MFSEEFVNRIQAHMRKRVGVKYVYIDRKLTFICHVAKNFETPNRDKEWESLEQEVMKLEAVYRDFVSNEYLVKIDATCRTVLENTGINGLGIMLLDFRLKFEPKGEN